MKMKTNFLCLTTVVVMLAFTFTACSKEKKLQSCNEHVVSACEMDDNKVNVRIENISDFDFCNLKIIAADGKTDNCGILGKGKSTCYRVYDEIYWYAYIQVFIDGQEFVIQPFDYVGETPLPIGKYTYLIDVMDYNERILSIELRED